jgi:hypothetical protein
VAAMESVEGYTVSETTQDASVFHLLQGGNRMGMGMSRAVEEMLVSAPGEMYIELFPMWPRGCDASFHNLRVKGAFLVSANWSAHGGVTFLEIEPAAIDAAQVKECAVMSPWQHVAQVTVHCAGGKAQPVPVAKESRVFIFRFRAENHQKCSVTPLAL